MDFKTVLFLSMAIPLTLSSNIREPTSMDEVDTFMKDSCICVSDENLVCASDGRIYRNKCEFWCRNNYLSEELDIMDLDYCVSKSSFSAEQAPSDVTTSSLLKLSTTAEVLNTWRPEFCSCHDSYKPVCGSNKRTYKNLCEFKCHSRYLNWSLSIVKFDACDSVFGRKKTISSFP